MISLLSFFLVGFFIVLVELQFHSSQANKVAVMLANCAWWVIFIFIISIFSTLLQHYVQNTKFLDVRLATFHMKFKES